MTSPTPDLSEPTRGQIPSEVPLENVSKMLRFLPDAFRWQGVAAEAYKSDTSTYKGMTRFELLGKRGESPQFHVRYFEIAPGGYSTLEQHEHEHCVIPLRGKGECQIGCRLYPLAFGDMIYVCPSDPHQFSNPAENAEPFGFLCIVNAERDRPVALDGLGVCEICE